MLQKKQTINKKEGSAVIISLITLILVITISFSILGIYLNKMHSIKNINDYYDKKILELHKEIK